MGIFDRIVLMLYTLSLTVLSATFVSMAAGWKYPLDFIRLTLENSTGRWATGLTSAAFLVVSLRFIWFVFSPGYPRRSIRHQTDLGEVYVALDAVESLVKKVTRQISGVRDVKAKVSNAQGGVSVYLKATVSPETSIPDASRDIQKTLRSSIKNVVGVELADSRIFVENIASEPRRGRVD